MTVSWMMPSISIWELCFLHKWCTFLNGSIFFIYLILTHQLLKNIHILMLLEGTSFKFMTDVNLAVLLNFPSKSNVFLQCTASSIKKNEYWYNTPRFQIIVGYLINLISPKWSIYLSFNSCKSTSAEWKF